MDGDVLVLGAMVRQAVSERRPEVSLAAPLLAEALGHAAHLPVRNSGTVGGSLAHAEPAAELPAVALALDAELVAHGPHGERRIPAADFFRASRVAPTPVRLPAAEEALQGTGGDAATAGLQPAADVHAGSETRIDIARDVLRRGIDRALERAGPEVRS